MNFKSIKLFGFKSFVDKTEISFDLGTTAIVGPNGCGKSNIVDSIKWVLGEQSSKSLRGTKMEDVIFNGSAGRKPLGMAEVSLCIDNSNRILPIDYTEVNITRRVYREEESEYLINNVPCRLKDIIDLFMDTGIGTNAYSFFEQGKIDAILSANPEDRRYLFDEVAGITKYMNRKKESLKKLKSTKENLDRVSDIISEIKTQMISLDRGAKKYVRYMTFKEDLKKIEIFNGHKEYNSMQNNLNSFKTAFLEKQNVLIEISTNNRTIETEIENLKMNVLEKEKLEQETNKKILELSNKIQELKNQEMVNKTKVENFVSLVTNFTQEIKNLEEKKVKYSEEIMLLKTEKEKLFVEIEEKRTFVKEKEELISVQNKIFNEEKKVIEKIKEEISEFVTNIALIENEITKIKITKVNFDNKISQIDLKKEKIEQEISLIQNKIKNLELNLLENKENIEKIEISLKELKITKEKETNTLIELEKNVREKKDFINISNLKLGHLKNLEENFEGYSEIVKQILIKKQDFLLNKVKILGTLGSLIKAKLSYEKVLEIALGEKLENIVVETYEDAEFCIEYLKKEHKGKITFIPLEIFKTYTKKNLDFSFPDLVIDQASNLIETSFLFQNMINFFFDKIVIVKQIDKNLFFQYKYTFVKLNGEKWQYPGIISAGEVFKTSGILTRKREIEELEAKLSILLPELENKEKEIEETINNFKQLNNSIEKLQQDLYAEKIKDLNCKKDLEINKQQEKKIKEEIFLLSKEKEEIFNEKEKIFKKEEELKSELKKMEDFSDEKEEMLLGLKENIENKEKEFFVQQKEIEDLKISLSIFIQKKQGIEENLEKLNFEFEEIVKNIENKQNEIEKRNKEKEILENLLKENNVLNFQKEKEEKENYFMAISQEKENCKKEIEIIENKFKSINKDFLETQTNSHELEIKISELEIHITHLENRLLEFYNVNIKKITEELLQKDGILEDISKERIEFLKNKLETMGSINSDALKEYEEVKVRYEFLTKQQEDLITASQSLEKIIMKINQESKKVFKETFDAIKANFSVIFEKLFEGGVADLVLIDENNILESGIEILVKPLGKRLQSISLLSGGEKSLTVISLLFAIFKVKPSPFCIFDEIDAALDDANIQRFTKMLKEFAEKTQFIIVTHNKQTMKMANVLYGITMEEVGVSKVISVKFKEQETTLPLNISAS
ncbi:MAG: chromosome segregation protein SMC [bacterium]